MENIFCNYKVMYSASKVAQTLMQTWCYRLLNLNSFLNLVQPGIIQSSRGLGDLFTFKFISDSQIAQVSFNDNIDASMTS